jgi:hypothetical protein
MLFALGAAASALDALQSLTSSKSKSPQPTGFDQSSTNPFDITTSSTQTGSQPPVVGGAGFTQISPATMSTLLAAQGQASTATTTSTASTTSASTDPSSALKDLFSQIDTNGDGQISKSEFENALGAGGTNIAQADDVFNKLDANGDGSVSLDEMSKALQGAGGKGGHHHHHVADSDGSNSTSGTSGTSGTSSSSSGAGGSNSDALLQALNGASSTSVTNSDGSTTTSITNADGSIITMTSPAATTSSSSATASYNFLEQMIQRAAQAISSGANASLSMSV